MLSRLPIYMIRCLVLTGAVETGLAALLGFRRRDLVFVALANLLTNPPAVVLTFLCGLYFGKTARIISIILFEAAVFITEALIYRSNLEKRRPSPFLLSLILNAASFAGGEIINIFFK